ncbi:MAG: hypothetical protein ACI85Q_000742 [Salibacteraceae bacterium]|jgi:hypothetical protein
MIHRIQHIVLLGWLIISSIAGFTQSERVVINPYSQEFLIGEQVRVELNVLANANETVIWPELKDTVTSQIEIIQSHPIDTVFEDSISRQNVIGFQKIWVITSFDSGLWAFPETTVWIDSIPFTTNPFLISVTTVEADTAKGFIDIVEPIELPMNWKEYIQAYYHYALIAIGIIMALAILAYLLGSSPKRTDDTISKIVIPAHVTALERLAQLQSESLWQMGAVKAYHIQVSDIVREYIENRFEIPVKESTTDEIKHLLKITRMEKSLRAEIIESLRISDLVKFAKSIPVAEENESCLATAYKLVESTKMEETPKLEEKGNE